ncbi:MAG: CpaF family protein [Acidimicrobiia bacterium]
MTGRVDPALVARLSRAVQEALVEQATVRAREGRAALSRGGQEALAESVLREQLQRIDGDRLATGAGMLDDAAVQALVERVMALSVGLGPVELLLADQSVEEIVATRFDLVFVYRSDGTVEHVDERLWASEAEMATWLSHLARTAGRTERQFNAQAPLLVMRLGDGLRLAATRDVSKHVAFALRRNTLGKVTLADLVGRQMMTPVVAELLRACMRSTEIRIVFSGPTGSGKTTLVRACLGELPPMARVLIIEDTAEIDLFDPVLHPNVESWEARLPNSEGEGAITPGQEVKHALRGRPDWLVAGEVRDSDAAVPMLKAMTHGQSSLTTVHAASAVGALDKLALYLGTGEDRLPSEVAHNQLHQAIDFVVHLDRGVDGRRTVVEVIEVTGFNGQRCTTNTIAGRDDAGDMFTLRRLDPRHVRVLRAAGFDDELLGVGLR